MHDGDQTPSELIQIVLDHLACGRLDIANAILQTLRDQLSGAFS